MAAIFIASVITIPSYPSSPRSRLVITSSDKEHGVSLPTIFGADTWLTIMQCTPASMPSLNGVNSEALRSSTVFSSLAIPSCVSSVTAPIPGKCFRQALIPIFSIPATAAPTIAPTAAGSPPKERFPIAEADTSVTISATGAKSRLNPSSDK